MITHLELQVIRYSGLARIHSFDPLLTSSALAHELNWILLLDYNLTLLQYGISNTRFVGLEAYAVG